MKLEIKLNDELFRQIREDNYLAEEMSDAEITDCLDNLVTEMSTPAGLSMLLENLDYFNY